MVGSKKIFFLGNFGSGNLGNESTLQAILGQCGNDLPDADITVVCSVPEDVVSRHGVPAIPISDRHGGKRKAGKPKRRRAARILFEEIPGEIRRWVEAFRRLKGADMLIMTGTGMITDDDGDSWGLPYEVMKWSALAKIRGCRVLYVSVGAEPIRSPKTKWLFKAAFSLADYRSFRDAVSREYLTEIGIGVERDPIYPDLAFGLPVRAAGAHGGGGHGSFRVIGVGLLDYAGQGRRVKRGDVDRAEYIRAMVDTIDWLVERRYVVRMLIGDIRYDAQVKKEIKDLLAQRGLAPESRQIIDEPVQTVSDLLDQISKTDLVIASRFHNVLLSLMLNIPVISLSYSHKNDALMSEFGLDRYCQRIDRFDPDLLRSQFDDLRSAAARHIPRLREKTQELRRALAEQYAVIFSRDPAMGDGRGAGKSPAGREFRRDGAAPAATACSHSACGLRPTDCLEGRPADPDEGAKGRL